MTDKLGLEVLARYGSPEQQQKWLVPLLNGEIRSAFAMTEKHGEICIQETHVSLMTTG